MESMKFWVSFTSWSLDNPDSFKLTPVLLTNIAVSCIKIRTCITESTKVCESLQDRIRWLKSTWKFKRFFYQMDWIFNHTSGDRQSFMKTGISIVYFSCGVWKLCPWNEFVWTAWLSIWLDSEDIEQSVNLCSLAILHFVPCVPNGGGGGF